MSVRLRAFSLVSVCLALAACGGGTPREPVNGSAAPAGSGAQINGAGATFPNPIYSKWFAEYNRLHPEVRINYQPIGSGGGIRQVTAQTVFFGATDGPMTDAQLKMAPGPILHLPTVLGAVVPVFNVPGVTDLKLNGATLAGIFLGKVRTWNDPALVKLNPGVTLPPTDITVVHRSDGSGTTFIFVDFLSKVSEEWKSKVGLNTSVNWPVGVGGKGNEGVAGLVSQTPGSIGYVELIYALQNTINFASVQNAKGEFVKASSDSVTKAAASAAAGMPADFRVSMTNADGEGAYPISSFTWMLLYESPADATRSRLMVDFMKWALTDGQAFAAELGYAPLPKNVVDLEMSALQKVKTS
jgi:phosphate transport system substrate-binding protein